MLTGLPSVAVQGRRFIKDRRALTAGLALALVLVTALAAAQVSAQGWGPEPRYEIMRFRRVAEPPPNTLAGNADVRMSRWEGFSTAGRALYRMRRFTLPGGAALLDDGRVINFYPGWGHFPARAPGDRIDEMRVYRRADILPYFESLVHAEQGVFPSLPARLPRFPGYVHRQSASVTGDGYIGIWWRRDGRAGSLVAAYLDRENAPPPMMLGRTPSNYRTIASYVPCAGFYGFTVTTEARPRQPVYMISYDWRPTPERSGGLMRPMAARPLPC